MVDLATLTLSVDASGMKAGDAALDRIAAKGAKAEVDVKISMKGVEAAFEKAAVSMSKAAEVMARSLDRVAPTLEQQTRTFDQLRRTIDPAYAASQRYAEIQRELASMVNRGEASQRSANMVLEQAASRYMGVATAAERAEQAQREQAAVVARLTGDYQTLRATLDPVYAASKRYEQSIETLNAALRDGVISNAQYQRSVQLLDQTMVRTPASAAAATEGTRNLGPAFVNASFQVQDFAVQVASGQSAMIAFAQQAPQLLGVLGFSGKLAMIGAGLGTLIAVGAAVAPMFFDIGKKAKSADDAIDNLTKAVGRYRQFADGANATSKEMRAEFGLMSEGASKMSRFLSEIAQVQALNAADAALKKVSETFGGFSREFDKRQMKPGANAWSLMLFGMDNNFMTEFEATTNKMRSELNLTEAQAMKVASGISAVADATSQTAKNDAIVALRTVFSEAFGTLDKVPAQLQAVAIQAGMAAMEAAKIVSPLEMARQKGEEIRASSQAVIGSYAQQAAMSAAVAKYGADSAQVEGLKRQEALRAADAIIAQEGYAGLTARRIREGALAAFDAATNADQAALALSRAQQQAQALANAMAAAAGFSTSLDNQIAVIDAQIGAARNKQDVAAAGQLTSLKQQAAAHRDASIAAANGEMLLMQAANEQYSAQMRKIDALVAGQKTLKDTVAVNNAAAKSGTSAAKASERLAQKLEREAEKWRATLSPLEKYQVEMRELQRLQGQLRPDEYARAVRQIGLEFADAVPAIGQTADAIANFVANGMRGFGDLLGSFKGMIKQMIATAIANPIKLGLTSMLFGSAGASAAVAGGAGSSLMGGLSTAAGLGNLAQGGGMMGGLLGAGSTLGGMLGGFGSVSAGGIASLAGGTGFLGGLGNSLSGGLANFFTMGGAGMTGSTGLAGIGASLGAAVGPLAAVAAAVSFFSKKTKELDRGLRVTVDGMTSFVEEFRKIETKRFWGLSKKVRTSYEAAGAETQDAIGRTVDALQMSILQAAGVLDFGAGTFANFAHTMQVSTKGLSEEDALKAVQEAVTELGDSFALMVPGLKDQILYGEGASAAISRLAANLSGVKDMVDLLDHRFKAAGLTGAGLATSLADAFGGLDAMGSAAQAYWGAAYTEQERLETTTRRATEALAELGVTMPKSRAEYRRMVEALDLTNEATHGTYAALLGMAGVMDQILPSVSGLTTALAALQGNVGTGLEGAISAANLAAQANEKAAGDWYKASGSIRDWITRMQGTASALIDPMRARSNNEAAYQATLARAISGDLAAAGEVTGAADRLLASVRDTARSQSEAAVAEARVLADLGLLAGIGDIEGARHDVIAGLLGQQADRMTQVRDYLAAGNVLTGKMIDSLHSDLGALEGAIAAAELINYQYLKERLAVTVDVIADASIPAHLKTLLGNAANGVTGYVDFITRSDLTPDLKWLALTKASEHIKTIALIARNKMPADLGVLALGQEGAYRVNVMAAVAGNAQDVLRLITGTKDGKVTLGGSFVFDPSTGFKTWYESQTKAAITNPMTALRDAMAPLRTALDALKAGITAEGARQSKAAADAARVAGAQATLAQLATKKDNAVAGLSGAIDRVKQFDAQTGGSLGYQGGAAQLGLTADGRLNYKADGVAGAGSGDLAQWRAQFWADGGLEDQMLAANAAVGQVDRQLEAARAAVRALGGVPAFARGGDHLGGLRLVGENGPELEATGPSRIYNASQTRQMLGGGNGELVAELRALRREVADLRGLQAKGNEHGRDTAKILKRIDVLGIKLDEDQNTVKTEA